jgi:hypothetical protein
MQHKNLLIPIAVLLLLTALVSALSAFWGVPLNDIVVGIVSITLYVVFFAVYLLRFAFIFFGVFAVYRILKERHNRLLEA